MRVWIIVFAAIVLAIVALLVLGTVDRRVSATDPSGCIVEPASPWAPQGYICPPIYGDGIASQWPGPGVARNDCVWPWTECEPIVIEVVATGRWVEVRPTMWCMCWVGVTGPAGETERIVDLDPPTMAALGLDPSRGLHHVRVYPAGGPVEARLSDNPAPSQSPGTARGDDGTRAAPTGPLLPDTAVEFDVAVNLEWWQVIAIIFGWFVGNILGTIAVMFLRREL